jgi:uncharacterized protein YecT (DUF1311 family)
MVRRRRTYGFSFSWRRALGISAAKGRLSRQIGIPLTKSGRERKAGRMMGPALLIAFALGAAITFKFNNSDQSTEPKSLHDGQSADMAQLSDDALTKQQSRMSVSSMSGETSDQGNELTKSTVTPLAETTRPSMQGPSFDCAKASPGIEKVICGDPELAEWDGRLGRAFKQKYAQLERHEGQKLREEQRRWIAVRKGQCEPLDAQDARPCILQLTKARVATFETPILQAPNRTK